MDLSKHEIKITDMKAFKVGNAQNLEAATGCTVMAGPVEATAIGNAMLQAIAVGKIDSVQSARKLIRTSFAPEVYTPKNKAAWDEAAVRFAEIMKK